MKRSSSLNRCCCKPHFTSSSRAFKRTSQPAFCLHRKAMIPGRGGNCLRGNPSRLGMLLHWTYLLSLWGDFKSVKKRQQLTDGDHLQVTRCKEGRSLQAVETWRVARPHCPAGRGQSQPELFENGWLTVELSHCGAAMSWFREGRRKAESASAIKVLCKLKEAALALRTMQAVPLRWCISNRFHAASCTGSS